MYNIEKPYLHFLVDSPDKLSIKTAIGVHFWCPEHSIGQLRLENCQGDLGIDDLSIDEAISRGAKTLLIGVANRGGTISEDWLPYFFEAVDKGMDIASGLHQRLDDIPGLSKVAMQSGAKLLSVRTPPSDLKVANGQKRQGMRLLGVGTDCSTGKMYTTLAIHRLMQSKGIDTSYCATGQTDIFIAGSGIGIDAVPADFIAGSVEDISPENNPEHWDIIEGQGSLFHPSYSGDSLGLIHGAQPDALVMCHKPTRKHMRGLPHYELPDIQQCIDANEEMARRTNPNVKTIGVSVNTSGLDENEAVKYLTYLE